MSTWKKLANAVSQLSGGSKTVKKPPGMGAPPVAETPEADDNITTNEAKIIEMLMHAIDSNSEIVLAFGSKIIVYKTRFLPEVETGPGATGAISSEYIRDKTHIRISATEPLDGLTKLQNGQSATVSFVFGNKFNEFEARLIDEGSLHGLVIAPEKERVRAATGRPPIATKPPRVIPGLTPVTTPPPTPPPTEAVVGADGVPTYKITFPDKIFRKPQRRASVRVKYFEDARVALSIKREAGVSFFAPIVDIGAGGVCFTLPDDEAPIAEGSEVDVTFYWDEEKELADKGTLIKMGSRHGKPVGQIAFATESYEVIRQLGELVAHIERARLQTRRR
ncbi:MAG: PilZ domain-containing protein [Magnetococcales bacterium]|nr:PilZ domain-containing protein [Magnetococcales bacterium]